jgi:hypothetical protein
MRSDMKKNVPFLSMTLIFLVLTNLLFSAKQQTAEKPGPGAASIPVAVRVFDGKQLVTSLTLQDFEVLENGIPRPVEALYLIDKNAIERREAGQNRQPDVTRKFYLLFQLFEYHPKLAEAIRYLFDQELLPGDSLEIQTPMRNYKLSAVAFANKPKNVLAEEMTNIVKKDIVQGGLAYNSLLNELKRHVRAIGGSNPMGGLETDTETEEIGLEMLLPRYKEILAKMEALRRIDIDKFILFAQALKNQSGQKFVFFIYQREFRPEISPAVIQKIMGLYQDSPHVLDGIQELFMFYTRNISQNTQRMRESFADSSAHFSLIFMNKAPQQLVRIVMREQSEDIFKAFSAVAQATGGIVDTSQNPAAGIKSALETSNKYYLLYFTPFSEVKDGTFRSIKIRVKDRDYSVVNRQGYIY